MITAHVTAAQTPSLNANAPGHTEARQCPSMSRRKGAA